MKPDTITVRVLKSAELEADSADLTVVIEGSMLFSGREAFKKAKEVRDLVEALRGAGVEEDRVKLRSVEFKSFALIKNSSAKYVVAVKTVSLDLLPQVLGAIAGHKGAQLSRLDWKYERLQETRNRLRREALAEALAQAHLDAEVLGVVVSGVHHVAEERTGQDYYNPEYVSGSGWAGAVGSPLELAIGNATTVSLDLRAEFRVSAFQAGTKPASAK